jgi:tRNA pseudouridine65 synthase
VRFLHRDEHLVVVDKPSGISVHRGWDPSHDHVVSRVKGELGGVRVYPVHRLDRGTSGCLVLALDEDTTRTLGEAFAEGRVEKQYVALVRGRPPDASFTVDSPVPKDEGSEERVAARTDFERLGSLVLGERTVTLVRAFPRTGRLHQIRRHLRHIHCSICGDTTYGDNKVNKLVRAELGLHRLALHAERIAFVHPASGRRLEVNAPWPKDMPDSIAALLAPSLG